MMDGADEQGRGDDEIGEEEREEVDGLDDA